mmetsp:Transcript_67186/g.194288  ORF Transcript_67186/g.194288 Transcript_67186/m.194288 type:complete len:236 (+) Transcript_67186:1503-2210(+)
MLASLCSRRAWWRSASTCSLPLCNIVSSTSRRRCFISSAPCASTAASCFLLASIWANSSASSKLRFSMEWLWSAVQWRCSSSRRACSSASFAFSNFAFTSSAWPCRNSTYSRATSTSLCRRKALPSCSSPARCSVPSSATRCCNFSIIRSRSCNADSLVCMWLANSSFARCKVCACSVDMLRCSCKSMCNWDSSWRHRTLNSSTSVRSCLCALRRSSTIAAMRFAWPFSTSSSRA